MSSEIDAGPYPAQPSAEQCSAGARVEFAGERGFACWYPQMGGYRAAAVIIPDLDAPPLGGCFDVLVWHDGKFPFDESGFNLLGEPLNPVRLHHCEASQFRAFADDVEAGLRKLGEDA